MIYIGIDVAKDKHDCFITNSEGEVLFNAFTIPNNADGFHDLFQKISSLTNDFSNVKVGLEATGHYNYNLLGFLIDKGLPTFVINPLHTNLFRKSLSLRQTKTDKVDAHTIALMMMSGVNLQSYSNTSYHNEELKSLTRYRFDKVQERAKLKTSISRLVNILFPELEKLVPSLHMVSIYALLAEFPSSAQIASCHLTRLTNLLANASKGHYNKEKAIEIRNAAKHSSFEKWYANQIKYHKVTGEEPGKELKSWSYSVKEVADLLGVDEYLVYDLLKKNQMEAVIVDYWKRIPKESFQNWYKSQSRYRTKEDRKKDALLEDATITMPEMAQLLGTTRSAVYTILDNPKYSHFFEFIVIAEKKRITKESFRKFLEGQDRYKLDPSNDYEELAQEQNIALANFRRKKLSQTGIRGSNGNIKYLTFDEASYLAKVSRSMINKWADKGKFTVIKVGSRVRIRRDEFEDWMEQRDLERSMQ